MPFITFEGIDGSGKSTLLQNFANHLLEQGLPVEKTREPGGSDLGPELRQILLRTRGAAPCPEAELLIYEADRAQHVTLKIKPWLAQGRWVLSDRFADSSIAFQGGGRKIKLDDVRWLNTFATQGLTPDLTVLVDVPVEVSQERRKKRKADRLEKEDVTFHENTRQEFLKLAKTEAKRFLVLDGQKSPEALTQELVTEVKRRGFL